MSIEFFQLNSGKYLLRSLWIKLIFSQFIGLVRINWRYLIVGDGIKIGAFMYHFWLKALLPRKRKSGDIVLQFVPGDFKEKISKKLNAYHLFIQLGFIAHGLMQYLSIHHHQIVWRYFGTWLRTIRSNTLPSEKVVALALSRTYIEFLIDNTIVCIFKKFLRKRTDTSQLQHSNFELKQAA